MLNKSCWAFSLLGVALFGAGCGTVEPKPVAPTAVVTVAVSPQSALLTDGQTVQFTAKVTGDASGVTWAVNGTPGGSATVGTIDSTGKYAAPATASSATVTVSAASKLDPSKTASAAVTLIASGVVASTANVQVAMYTITPPSTANVSVQFGPDTSYGLTTWQQPSPAGGGAVSILVAGMKLNATYHMRAVLTFSDGSQFSDIDHTFATGDIPVANLPTISASTTAGATPQDGVELLDLVAGTNQRLVLVTDLAGNIIWTYDTGLPQTSIANPIKLLPNGHFLINLSNGAPDGAGSILREVDLTGQVVWQLNVAQLNKALAAATCAGCNITIVGTHHDFVALPNGHLIVIAAQDKVETGLVGFPDPVTVSGDVVIDLDQNHKPVWAWSEFDHFDLNRHPMAFPDWMHTNAIVYSPDDKSLIVSLRHQDWVVKVDYNDGQGTGSILWKLGYQGDFSLQDGTDPQDWFYAQHDVNVISPNSSGTFQLLLFDNGNQRVLDSAGTICGVTGAPPCVSHVPILQLDETAKTATIEWLDDLSPIFSTFGGSARLLANGNVEFAECAPTAVGAKPLPTIFEVTKTTPPQPVWQLQVTGQNIYRGFRIPSLYPGVQW
jgi:arylsulfate sulfotransferase